MKKFLGLLLCFSLTFLNVTRATKPNHTTAASANTAQKGGELTAKQKAKFETIKTQQKHTDEGVASTNDDSMEDASDDEGAAINDDGGDAAGDKNTGDDDKGEDDSGDNGGDDGGGDGGE
jgi:hypothetical protein